MSARAKLPPAANDPNVRVHAGPPVNTWLRLLAYVRGVKAKGRDAEKSTTQRALEFMAHALTVRNGWEDLSSNEMYELVYDYTLNGGPKLTIKACKQEIADWRDEHEENVDQDEDGPFDMRDELEEYFS